MFSMDRNSNSGYDANCLAKDVPNLPTNWPTIKNGCSVYIMDTPDGTNATSKLYKFDEENKRWIAQ
jgi:hypothetical protein